MFVMDILGPDSSLDFRKRDFKIDFKNLEDIDEIQEENIRVNIEEPVIKIPQKI